MQIVENRKNGARFCLFTRAGCWNSNQDEEW